MPAPPLVLVRGGGDLATGVVARLWRSGFWVIVMEIEKPLAVRRLVSVAEAVYRGAVTVEDLRAIFSDGPEAALQALRDRSVPVIVDPAADSRSRFDPIALVDARMLKASPELDTRAAPFMVGLGPGFEAGLHVHAVVETQRGHRMGRVIWQGQAQADTGIPDPVEGQAVDRVLRAPASGIFEAQAQIGTLIKTGDRLAAVDGIVLEAPFDGALRGLMHAGVEVDEGVKVGDLDPRLDVSLCSLISDKALAIGGGVLEALLSRPEIRQKLSNSTT